MELLHVAFDDHIAGLKPKEAAPVYLLFGDDMLVRQAFTRLLNALVPVKTQSLNYVAYTGGEHPAGDVLEAMDTHPMFPATKVVGWHDTRFLAARQETGKFLDKAREAWEENEPKKAARAFLDFCAIHEIAPQNLPRDNPSPAIVKAAGAEQDLSFLPGLLDYIREEGMSVSGGGDEAEALSQALARGFPKTNHLVITAALADKRKRLYKQIAETGVVVECTLPQGLRKADKDAQLEVFARERDRVLARTGKKMDPAAFTSLFDRVGADLGTFVTSIEKLALYAGDRARITAQDVDAQISRTRENPVFDLTGAVFDKNLGEALRVLGRLLDNNMFPLQVLGALASQCRKMLAVRSFLDGPRGGAFRANMDFQRFSASVFNLVQQHDQELLARLSEQGAGSVEDDGEDQEAVPAKGGKGKKKEAKKESKAVTDLVIAGGAKNPYAVYQNMLKASRFSRGELEEMMLALRDADRRLKSSGTDPRIVLERVLFQVCA
jgi:DNA polymerase-3 subunit delta